MDQRVGRAERVNPYPGSCVGGGLYQNNLQSSRIIRVPGNSLDVTIPMNLQLMSAPGMPSCNWANGLGPTKLLTTSTPQTTQLPGLQDISQQQQQVVAPEGFLHGSIAKDGMFGIVNDPKLGPVEKAVLHQAMYNQSKKSTPEMRRCDDCNVIFNSQNQAEMHYKGKKHAKVMFVKRNRETKRSSIKPTFPIVGAEDQQSAKLTPDAITPNTNDLMPHEIGPRIEQPYEVDSPPEYNMLASENTRTADQNMESLSENTYQGAIPNHCAITEGTGEINTVLNERAISEERISPLTDDVEDNPDDDDSKTKIGLPPREPVVLPDPLPRYISRIEKPTVLKESLRCTVCDIYVNSENQMRQHVNSLRHKNIEKGIPTPPKPVKEDKPKGRSEQFRCEVCRVTLNSDIQLLQHLSSQRHRNMLEGKPPKPRWTPYERTQHALLRSAAHLRLSALKTIPNGGSPILLSPAISGTPSPLQLSPRGPLGSSVIAQASPPTHLKQMAYITSNGGILQAQEIVYISAPPQTFAHHQPQAAHQIPANATALLRSHIPGIPQDLSNLLNTQCVNLDHRELGFNWSPGI